MLDYIYHKLQKKSICHFWLRFRLVFRRLSCVTMIFLSLPGVVFAKIPNDPHASQWSYKDIGVYDAWDRVVGSRDVVVAVIDNGFDSFHPDLESNLWKNTKEVPDNGIDDDGNGYVDDVYGWNFIDNNNNPRPSVFTLLDAGAAQDEISHGTMVAGIIGAVGDNGQFGTGINWRVRLMNLKVLGNSGSDTSVVPIGNAIRYAVDNGAQIINISLIGPEDEGIRDAVHYAFRNNVAVFAAAGNDYFSLNDNRRDPICADLGQSEQWVLGVSAIDEGHHLARFSNIGSCIDITAPGVHVSTTLRYAPAYGLNDYYGGPFSGTSFATPFVSGAAALLKSIHPEWGAREIYSTLLSTVHKTPPKDEYGYAQAFGRGLLQVNKAVSLALATASTGRSFDRVTTYTLQSPSRLKFISQTTTGQSLNLANLPSFTNVESLLTTKDDQRTIYVALLKNQIKKKTVRQIAVYDGDWNRISIWSVPWSGETSVALVGGVAGQSTVVIAPKTPGRIVFQSYSLSGKTIQSKVAEESHQGVILGSIRSSGVDKLLAVYKEKGNLVLHKYDDNLQDENKIVLESATKISSVGAGDLDGNGSIEYVVASAPGEAPRLYYYDSEGGLLRKFISYNGGYQGGVGLLVGDFDHDGADDVVTAPASLQSAKNISVPIRVWSGRSRVISEWLPFGETNKNGIGLLPVYR